MESIDNKDVEPPFRIQIGPASFGWCDFSVSLGDASWSCDASYLGAHPLYSLIHSAVDLYGARDDDDYLFPIWDSLIEDEPGGIVVRVRPEGDKVRLSIYQFHDCVKWPDAKEDPGMSPVGEAVISYWSFADAVFEAAAIAVVRQGVTGLRENWQPGQWDAEKHSPTFSYEYFLYLGALVKHRLPKEQMSFREELEMLRELEEKYAL